MHWTWVKFKPILRLTECVREICQEHMVIKVPRSQREQDGTTTRFICETSLTLCPLCAVLRVDHHAYFQQAKWECLRRQESFTLAYIYRHIKNAKQSSSLTWGATHHKPSHSHPSQIKWAHTDLKDGPDTCAQVYFHWECKKLVGRLQDPSVPHEDCSQLWEFFFCCVTVLRLGYLSASD